jgi:hypothetical protein
MTTHMKEPGATPPMTYLLQHQDADEFLGIFDSLQEAYNEAKVIAKDMEETRTFEIYDTRPATTEDRDLFEESDFCENTDWESPEWPKGLFVPENIVLIFTVDWKDERELAALRATAEQLARALEKTHPVLMREIGRLSLNKSAANGTQATAREVSEMLDAARELKLLP